MRRSNCNCASSRKQVAVISLPVKDFWAFDALVTVSDPQGVEDLDALDRIYHCTELIQSSPIAVERSVHGAIGGAYACGTAGTHTSFIDAVALGAELARG